MFIDLSLKIDQKNASSDMARKGHYGTHLDIMENSEVPIEHFVTTGKLIDITELRHELIQLDDIVNSVSIAEGDFVFFRSHWLRDHGYGTPTYFKDHPHFSDEVIDYLLDKQIAFIGLDFPGAQRKEKHIHVDHKCAAKNVYIVENLNNLEKITTDKFNTFCFPMHIAGQTGIPVRVLVDV